MTNKSKHKTTSYPASFKFSTSQTSDNDWIGDEMPSFPDRNHTRFWLQNCNGLVTANDINQFIYQMQQYLDHDINYISLTETRINSSHIQTSYQIEHGYTQLVKHGRMDMTNTPGFNTKSAYQPGGVAAAFHGRLADRFSKTIRDKAGRWIIHEFIGKERPLRVYTLYRVNPKASKADISAWAQQKMYLQQMDCDQDPRSRVVDDIIDDISLSIQNGCHVLLMGDLNEHTNSVEKTNNKLYEIGLHNVLQQRLAPSSLPRTHRRGSQAIDHIWVTTSMLPSIEHTGFAPFNFIGNSDHRGMYIDVNLSQLLHFNIIPLQPIQNRRLQSKIPKRTKEYLKILKKIGKTSILTSVSTKSTQK